MAMDVSNLNPMDLKKQLQKGMKQFLFRATPMSMDVTRLLQKDHREVDALFAAFEACAEDDTGERQRIADEIFKTLGVHADAEEKLVYPTFRNVPSLKEKMDEAQAEHAFFKQLMRDLQRGHVGQPAYNQRMAMLREGVRHHVMEEEREIFRIARNELDRQQLMDLGQQVMAYKESHGIPMPESMMGREEGMEAGTGMEARTGTEGTTRKTSRKTGGRTTTSRSTKGTTGATTSAGRSASRTSQTEEGGTRPTRSRTSRKSGGNT